MNYRTRDGKNFKKIKLILLRATMDMKMWRAMIAEVTRYINEKE